MDEFDLIERYFSRLSSKEGLDLKDDGAVFAAQSKEQVVVTDNFVESIHFLPGDSPSLIAKKLLRRNVSDLLAMGAKPRFYLLNLFLTKEEFSSPEWLEQFSKGLEEDQTLFKMSLIGGDTTLVREGKLSFALTAIGELETPKSLNRSGALVGDDVWVTGVLGLAYEGLLIRFAKAKKEALPFTLSQPDVTAALQASQCPDIPFGFDLSSVATSAMDISDSFIQDCSKVAKLSKVTLALDWESIPKPQNIWGMNDTDFKKAVLAGGDDYQLVFTAPKSERNKVIALARESHVSVSRIGEVQEGDGQLIINESGKALDLAAFKQGWTYKA